MTKCLGPSSLVRVGNNHRQPPTYVLPYQRSGNIISLPNRALITPSIKRFSGLYVTYDLSKEPNNRVVEALVRCTECIIPEYLPLEDDRTYRAAMPTYNAEGGDGYDVIAKYRTNVNRGKIYNQDVDEKTVKNDMNCNEVKLSDKCLSINAE